MGSRQRRAAYRLAIVVVLAAVLGAACESSPSPAPSGSQVAQATSGPDASDPTSTDGVPVPSAPPSDPGPATAADLIVAARDAGRIDAATALLYRVYAVFGDPRLPAEFASGEWTDDEAGVGAAEEQLNDLPPEIAAEVRPYLVRPTDPTSVFAVPAGTARRSTSEGPKIASTDLTVTAQVIRTSTCGSNGWGYIDGVGKFRVWGRCGGDPIETIERDALILRVAELMERLWTDETTYLGRAPIPDDGTVDNGGADPDLGSSDPGRTRIDVYVTTGSIRRGGEDFAPTDFAVAIPSDRYEPRSRVLASSGFIVMNSNLVARPAFARATLAHELFHVLQNAFNREGVRDGDDSYWFVESSAVWAQWRFAPEGSAIDHETMTPGRFEGFQDSPRSLTDAYRTSNRYWSWAWPLFMAQESPGAVAAAWRAIEGKRGDVAVTRAVDGVTTFSTRFRDFAVRAYNRELSPTQDADLRKLFPDQAVGTPRVPPGTPRLDDEIQLHAEIPGVVAHTKSEFISSLYAVYRPFKVDDEVGKVVFDFSGLSPQATFDVDAIVKVKDKGWERRKLPDGEYTFCRDKAADRVEEIVIVLSNHDLDRNARVVGTWTVESLALGCAALTGVLTIERTASFLQLDPAAPDERRDEHLTATIVVNMRPDPWTGGYTDAYDQSDAASVSSTYTVERTFGASKRFGDCTASFSTRSSGTWQFKDHPTDPEDENGITGFIDRAAGVAGFSVVIHYPYEVVEDICNLYPEPNVGVHDAFVCLDTTYNEVDGGPDRIEVHCSSDVPGLGYSLTTETIDGTLYVADE